VCNPETLISKRLKLSDAELNRLDLILTDMERKAGIKGNLFNEDGIEEVLDLLEVIRLDEDENRQLMNLEDLLSNI